LTEFNDFDRCPNLTVLILNDNKIKKIFPGIVKLQRLKTLDLSNNDLPDLPSEVGFIDSLVRMQIEGNALKAIRQNIRAAGTNQLKKYLRDRMDVGQRQAVERELVPSSEQSPHEVWNKLLQEFTMNG
jgi:Leucine-rich repeat (LRR) protein